MSTTTPTDTITHIWLRFNPKWIVSGIVSGIIAGLVMIIAAGFIGADTLGEFTQPMKYLGATFFGPEALRYGSLGLAGFVGLLFHLFMSSVYGATFAQLVHEKSKPQSLLAIAMITSWIIWIFGFNLFMPSVNLFLKEATPIPIGVLLHLLFGFTFGIVLPLVRGFVLKPKA